MNFACQTLNAFLYSSFNFFCINENVLYHLLFNSSLNFIINSRLVARDSCESTFIYSSVVQAEKSDFKCYDKGNSLYSVANVRLECKRGWPILRGQMHLRINVNNLTGERRRATGLQSRNRSTFDDYSRALNPSSLKSPCATCMQMRICKCPSLSLFLSLSLSLCLSLCTTFVARRQKCRINKDMEEHRDLKAQLQRWEKENIHSSMSD